MAVISPAKIKEVITSKLQQVTRNDFFELLDVDESASPKQVKDSYFQLARIVHPDSLEKHSLGRMKDDATLVFNKLTEAYKTLSDAAQRATYLEGRRSNKPAVEDSKLVDEQAKIALHQGKLLLNRRAWDKAEAHLRILVELRPSDARGYVLLGWCLFQNNERALEDRLQEARFCFSKAVTLDDNNADAHFYLSLYYKERGDARSQEKELKRTLSLNGTHVAAKREMRLLEMRRGKEEAPQPKTLSDYLKELLSRFSHKKS